MQNSNLLPKLIQKITAEIANHADEITLLDQEIGDGDHVTNLQRGLQTLFEQRESFANLDLMTTYKQIGMLLMSKVGGASGSLFATLFLAMSKTAENESSFANIYAAGVEAMKARGKTQAGEKTMLDVLIPVSDFLNQHTTLTSQMLMDLKTIAIKSAESTIEMQATKGRASFLGERSVGVMDAGACSCKVIICAIADVLLENLPT
jgi:dihydroxyacetone kinase-like protein